MSNHNPNLHLIKLRRRLIYFLIQTKQPMTRPIEANMAKIRPNFRPLLKCNLNIHLIKMKIGRLVVQKKRNAYSSMNVQQY